MSVKTIVEADQVVRGRRTKRPKRVNVAAELARIPLYLWAVVVLIPFWWMIIAAFKTVPELMKNPPTFFPENPSADSFYDPEYQGPGGDPDPDHVAGVFQRWEDVAGGFFRFALNSFGITVVVTVLSLLIASLAAYMLTKTAAPGRRTAFVVIISSMMIPWQVSLIPNYLLTSDLGMTDSYLGYIIPGLAKAFVVFFLVQYLRSIPDDLVHAARVDGASEWRIWWQIILPLLRPALAAMAIFVALGEWNNFLWPLIIIRSDELMNLPVALSNLNNAIVSSPGQMGVAMAASLLATLPTVVFFFLFQKHFIKGIALSGIKA
ncbi:carbohydrate ABC transporter permease [Glycomyces sp. TRM65418]|uniref:carbohydrate ABC transporter permease n=1 Tax=Glycomyces sp. TRM65418 TaxID=2867006 RepID=UPI001CE5DF69|nr:carbohydrate ABC transporter permease [Glycomyces sp. TRM65418]MCC3764929.1 carbohydrate ABC transporter permease [Glycomyces sp. TRM65418]QZD54569.1 carbohydrate ABC transporter permease [Glycomyces sp. TRM65418]